MEINIMGFIPVLLPVALSPGASFTLAMNSALAGGRGGLLRTLAGTALGIYTHALLIGLGVTAILVSSPALFNVLKYAGAAYLMWLGVQLIRSGLTTSEMTLRADGPTVTLKEAWLANVLNPKAIVFYLTVVSQFAGSRGDVSHYLLLATVHVLVMGAWLIALSNVLVFSAQKANPVNVKRVVNLAGGAVLIIFSVLTVVH
ncbi:MULTISPECIES: LysE family translocator [Kosakonia]|uniref:LysE family translocator n=1 Tax=Kosakonia TaxID=1330547 RepID=UPI0019076A86|nr:MULTISPECIES: LysE family translocator [Kosakonia]MBK0079241.1 LysE family translocator [Kosakonia sp. S57]MBK0086229.1 LysE family translocator [Kosakonia sp. S58]WKW41085.1 LysE family translocator [Kosakonia cowanii]